MTYNSIKTIESADPTDPDVAVDRVGGLDYQRIKLQWGPEGTVNDTDDASGKRFPVNLSQSALIGAVDETAPASDTASSGLNGRLQRIAQRITSLIALFPTALGSQAASASFAVTASTEDIARIGATNETAPASDTATAGLNGRLQRIAQRLTSLIALLPTSLGSKSAANSFAVTASTEDIARIGAVDETAPGTDTASSGLNGRLQRIAQRLTSLIALLPAALTTVGSAFKTGASEGTLTCKVTNGQTVSAAVDTAGLRNAGLYIPSTFDGTTLSFQVSHDNSTYQVLYDILNNQVSMTVAASRNYDLPGELMAWRYWKLVCGTSQSSTDTDFVIVGRT